MVGIKLSRVVTVWAAGLLLGLVVEPAHAAFSSADLKCRETISKQGAKLAQQAAKTLNECHTKRVDGALPEDTDCNSTVAADTKSKIQKAADKLLDKVPEKCASLTPSALNYVGCPSPCDSAVPAITDFNHVAACIECTTRVYVESMTGSAQGDPGLPLGDPEARCHDSIGSNQTKHFLTVVKERRKCQKSAEKGGAMDVSSCVNADPKGKIAKTRNKVEAALEPACAGAVLASLDSCAEITLDAVESCVFDDSAASSRAFGTRVFRSLYELNPGGGATTTTFNGSTTSTTTTTMGGGGPQDPQCPNKAELILYAGTRGTTCANNGDCGGFGECNTTLGRCTTVSELDTGWTGIAHDADIIDEAVTVADINCPGPAPTCGECTIAGLNPDPGYCRCANNNRVICDQPFAADANDCGGDLCNCYFGVPLPLSSGNTPACVVNRFRLDSAERPTSTPATGETAARLRLGRLPRRERPRALPVLRRHLHGAAGQGGQHLLGESALRHHDRHRRRRLRQLRPDPERSACEAAPAAVVSTTVRAATSGARHESFPAPGGAAHSLDCFPNPGVNVSGAGLRIDLDSVDGRRARSPPRSPAASRRSWSSSATAVSARGTRRSPVRAMRCAPRRAPGPAHASVTSCRSSTSAQPTTSATMRAAARVCATRAPTTSLATVSSRRTVKASSAATTRRTATSSRGGIAGNCTLTKRERVLPRLDRGDRRRGSAVPGGRRDVLHRADEQRRHQLGRGTAGPGPRREPRRSDVLLCEQPERDLHAGRGWMSLSLSDGENRCGSIRTRFSPATHIVSRNMPARSRNGPRGRRIRRSH